MTPPPDQPERSSPRPIGPAPPARLWIEPHIYGGETYWVVKDPLAARYFHLAAEEHAILHMLDGSLSLEQLKHKFERVFAPLKLTLDQLHAFLGRLHGLGLLLSEGFGQGEQLGCATAERRRRGRWLAPGQCAGNSLAGHRSRSAAAAGLSVLPLALLALVPGIACAAMVFVAIGLVAVHFSLFQAKLPDLHAFLTPQSLVWLFVALAAVKVIARTGPCADVHARRRSMPRNWPDAPGLHALPVLRRFRRSGRFAGKWRRIAVSAAGIVVEVCLAAAATFALVVQRPGRRPTLCLHLMIVCSVSTLLFNGNPLLRYDGYYVLADWLEVPNLGQQSRALLNRLLSRVVLGTVQRPDRSLPSSRRVLLVAYAAASLCYRWVVLAAVLWFCYRAAKAQGAAALAVALIVLVVAGAIMPSASNALRQATLPIKRRGIRWPRVVVVAACLLAAVAFLLLLPLPYHVSGPAFLEVNGGRAIYVTVPGQLVEAVAAGAAVHRGDLLARLVNLDVDRQIADLAGQCEEQRVQLESALVRQTDDPRAAAEIPLARSMLADLEVRLAQRQLDRKCLTLRAPVEGVVLPPPLVEKAATRPRQLALWQGSPLDPRNRAPYWRRARCYAASASPMRWKPARSSTSRKSTSWRRDRRCDWRSTNCPVRSFRARSFELSDLDVKRPAPRTPRRQRSRGAQRRPRRAAARNDLVSGARPF